jgi:hypothetical protein
MPRGKRPINMLLRVVALLFCVIARFGSMESEACCPAARAKGSDRQPGGARPIANLTRLPGLIPGRFDERVL